MAENTPFGGLSVTFHWSEAPITDFAGKHYPNDQDLTLTGEKAYEFLVQLNTKDKEAFDKRTLGRDKSALYQYNKPELASYYLQYASSNVQNDTPQKKCSGARSSTWRRTDSTSARRGRSSVMLETAPYITTTLL